MIIAALEYIHTHMLKYKKTANPALLSLFMRTNGKRINSRAPKHQLKRYSAFHDNSIFLKDPNIKKYQHYIDARGEALPTPHRSNDSCCEL